MNKQFKDYTSFQLNQDDIFKEARLRCMREMYAKAQPSANYDDILKYYENCSKSGIKPERIYERHYLSHEEFEYILRKYIQVYHFEERFTSDCDILINDMLNGCSKDLYIPDLIENNGTIYYGHTSYEKVPPLAKLIGNKDAKRVINFIKQRRDFYRFDNAQSEFSTSISLADSPSSNAESVIEYWKSQGIDIKIDPRHYTNDDFWSEENEYECLIEENE